MWFYREIKKEKNRITSDDLHFLSKLTCTKISGVKNRGCILKKNEKTILIICASPSMQRNELATYIKRNNSRKNLKHSAFSI